MIHEGRLALSFETNPTNQALVDSFETAIRLRKAFPNDYWALFRPFWHRYPHKSLSAPGRRI
jgi:hypothetical protein